MDQLDDYTLADICRQMATNGDYQGLSRLVRSGRRQYNVCNQILNEMLDNLKKSNTDFINLTELRSVIDGTDVLDNISNQNEVVLWGRGTFTIKLPYRSEEDYSYDTIKITGPITFKTLLTKITKYYQQHTAPAELESASHVALERDKSMLNYKLTWTR